MCKRRHNSKMFTTALISTVINQKQGKYPIVENSKINCSTVEGQILTNKINLLDKLGQFQNANVEGKNHVAKGCIYSVTKFMQSLKT